MYWKLCIRRIWLCLLSLSSDAWVPHSPSFMISPHIDLALSILIICSVFIVLGLWYYRLFKVLEDIPPATAMADAHPASETTTRQPLRDRRRGVFGECSHVARKLKRKFSNINTKSNEDATIATETQEDDELDEFCCLGRSIIRCRRGCRRQSHRIRGQQGRNHGIWPEALNSRPTFRQWCRQYTFDQILLGAISMSCLVVSPLESWVFNIEGHRRCYSGFLLAWLENVFSLFTIPMGALPIQVSPILSDPRLYPPKYQQ